jgi:hypothetical protein
MYFLYIFLLSIKPQFENSTKKVYTVSSLSIFPQKSVIKKEKEETVRIVVVVENLNFQIEFSQRRKA